jgi:hypothetical protein
MFICYFPLLTTMSIVGLIARRYSGVSSGTQAPCAPRPGDKSPGYCHMTLRDAFWPALRPRS